MNVLNGYEPEKVFRFFEEICSIPHGSFHTRAISDYIVRFAKERGLRCRQEDTDNVIIWKDATAGYEQSPTVMIQGHIDMVCEKEDGCSKDMENEGLDLFIENGEIGARGTTLGGDDGIAVAIALAVLDSDDIPHAPLECVFTTGEEVGMTGARALDVSDLKASYMLNIDSEEEGVLTVSCAGSTRAVCSLPVSRESFSGDIFRISIGGLKGGHSGEEIHKGRANSNILMGRVLHSLAAKTGLRIITVSGGSKDNAIPRTAEALVSVSDPSAISGAGPAFQDELRNEFHTADGDIEVSISPAGPAAADGMLPFSADSTKRVICFLFCAPNSVQMMSADVPGLVQTSLNMGQVRTVDNAVEYRFMVRSSVNSQKDETTERVICLAEALGGTVEIPAAYSAWEYRPDSKLRDIMTEAFSDVYDRKPVIAALHAGLECGILSGKMPSLDCISYGPDLTQIHTPRERLNINSTERTWRLTLKALALLK